jgi:hypothetical protein
MNDLFGELASKISDPVVGLRIKPSPRRLGRITDALMLAK